MLPVSLLMSDPHTHHNPQSTKCEGHLRFTSTIHNPQQSVWLLVRQEVGQWLG